MLILQLGVHVVEYLIANITILPIKPIPVAIEIKWNKLWNKKSNGINSRIFGIG